MHKQHAEYTFALVYICLRTDKQYIHKYLNTQQQQKREYEQNRVHFVRFTAQQQIEIVSRYLVSRGVYLLGRSG